MQSTALVKSEKAMQKHAAKKAVAKRAGERHPAKHHPKKHEKHGPHGHDGKHAKGKPEKGKPEKGKPDKGGKDLRRAYEHLARVRVLLANGGDEPTLHAAAKRLAALVTADLRSGHAEPKVAAELSRAAEHIAFAGLVAHDAKALPWSEKIEGALADEYRKLRESAELPKKVKNGGERSDAIRTLHALMLEAAEAGRSAKNYTKAMECVRSAESLSSALAHAE